MSNAKIHLRIVSPVGTVFDGETSHVVLPGEKGAFAIFPQHAALISSLTKGTIKCFDKGQEERFFEITGGFAEVKKDVVTVSAELPGGENKGLLPC